MIVLRTGACAIAVLAAIAAPVHLRAQAPDDRGGFVVRELSLSTGVATQQLPPITLDGHVPSDALDADLIASGAGGVDWRHVTPHSQYTLAASGVFTSRSRYSRLDAPGASLSFGVTQALGRRWHLTAILDGQIATSDQLAFQPTQTRRLVDGARSFGDLADTTAFAHSPSPDLSQAALYVPINETLGNADVYGNRVFASGVRAEATYSDSARLQTFVRGGYATDRVIASNASPGQFVAVPDSSAADAIVGVRYGRSERSQLTGMLAWSRASGSYTDEALVATIGYAWSGRGWFAATSAGTALRPFRLPTTGPLTTIRNQSPAIVGSVLLGYTFDHQTLLAQYHQATHDEYGHGGRDIVTGFEGNVQTVGASWSWLAPRSRWMARSDFSMLRGPGNFSFIYAWLATAGVGRQLNPNVTLTGELIFDRHGSRAFEGFDLMEEGVRVVFAWTPRRRPVA
ncbi:MAG TPA: hypothetical protein VH583_18440 [Vicinamibacterales bacterium]|jgi:hypothetical protein